MDKMLAKVFIGDCEGYHTTFSHFIELSMEHYRMEYGNHVRLTESGRKHFKGTHKGWDVNYINYNIELCTSLTDLQKDYEELSTQFAEIKSNLDMFDKYLAPLKPKGISRDVLQARIVTNI